MLSFQRHYIIILYYTIKHCTSDTNTTIYPDISTTSPSLSLDLTTSNIYNTTLSPSQPSHKQSKSIFNDIIHYEVDGLNLIFLIICAILLLCTFCCVFGYFICQHSRRKRMLKEQIAANTAKHKQSLDGIHEDTNNNNNDINIQMDNNNTSNTMTSSFDNNDNNNNNNKPIKYKSNDIPQFNDNNSNNFGIGSPKNHLNNNNNNNILPEQMEQISPINMQSHSHISSPNNTEISPQQMPIKTKDKNENNTNNHTHKKHKNGIHSDSMHGHGHGHGHVQVPSNLAAEMEMASFIPMGMDIKNKPSDDSTDDIDTTDDEKQQLKQNNNYPSPQTKKMRSFSRRTASLDNFNAKKIAYDDMAKDPELAQYAANISDNNNNNEIKNAYKISNVSGHLSDDDSDSTSESSDDSTDDDTTSDDTEGTSTSISDDDSDDSDDDSDTQSEDGGHYDTTTGHMLENFGKGINNIIKGNNNNQNINNKYQKHLILNNNNNGNKYINKSPKSKKKSVHKASNKIIINKEDKEDNDNDNDNDNDYNSSESTLKDDDEMNNKIDEICDSNNNDKIDIINPIKFIKLGKKIPKKHHVKDNSDASFGSYDNYDNVKKILKNDINKD